MTIYLLRIGESLPHGKACESVALAIAEAVRSIQAGHHVRVQYEDGRDVEATDDDIDEAATLLGWILPEAETGDLYIKAEDAARELAKELPHDIPAHPNPVEPVRDHKSESGHP